MGPLLPCQWVGWLLPVPVAFTRALCAGAHAGRQGLGARDLEQNAGVRRGHERACRMEVGHL